MPPRVTLVRDADVEVAELRCLPCPRDKTKTALAGNPRVLVQARGASAKTLVSRLTPL